MPDQAFGRRVGVFYLLTSFDIGGAQKALVRLLGRLDRQKYRIDVAALATGSGEIVPQLKNLGINPIDLRASRKSALQFGLRLGQLLKRKAPDILCCSLFHATIVGRIVGRLTRVPIVLNWEHNEHLGGVFRVASNRLTWRLSDIIIPDSRKVEKIMVSKFRVPPERLRLIPIGGVDFEEFTGDARLRDENELNIVSVGKLRKQKGYHYLIGAAKILRDEGYRSITFSVAGTGEEEDALRKQIQDMGLEDQFRLTGYKEDVPEFLRSGDIYVQPSLWEGLCISVVEAMAMRLPIVASAVGGIPESVMDKTTGILVPPADPKALALALKDLINDVEMRRSFGQAGRERSERNNNLEQMVDGFDALLEETVRAKLGLRYDPVIKDWIAVRETVGPHNL